MTNPTAPLPSDDERVRQIMEQYVDDEFLASKLGLEDALLQLCTTIRQEERTAERKRVLDVIKRVPATAAGADAFRKRLIEELYVDAAANETREDGDDG